MDQNRFIAVIEWQTNTPSVYTYPNREEAEEDARRICGDPRLNDGIKCVTIYHLDGTTVADEGETFRP